MEENTNIKMTPKQWIENFWYHYKWHTVVGVFAVLVVVMLTVQMCTKQDYDAHIMYAGNYNISTLSQDGDLPEYKKITSALSAVCPDSNGDGKIDVNLQKLFVLTPEQSSELDADDTSSLSLSQKDSETLDNMLVVGNYYVCFMSYDLFMEKDAIYDGAIFEPIAKYATDESIEYEYASERGIFLRSLPYASGLSLPDDTVVCLRSMNGYSSVIGSKENQRNFEIGETIIKNILNFK